MSVRGAGVPCAGCGAGLDALRAGHAAHLDGRFVYFCGLSCRQRYVRQGKEISTRSGRRLQAAALVVSGTGASVDAPEAPTRLSPLPAFSRVTPLPRLSPVPPLPRLSPVPLLSAAEAAPRVEEAADEVPEGEPGDVDGLLLFIAATAGFLSIALVLLGTTRAVMGARGLVAAVGALALVGRAAVGPRVAGDGPRWLSLAPLLSALLALAAWALRAPIAADATMVTGVMVVTAAAQTALQRRLAQRAESERRWIAAALALPGRRVDRDDLTIVAAHELRPGEFLRVEAGEIAPVDLQITSGRAAVFPWLGSTHQAERSEGETLVAGARVVEGAVEGVATWTGHERAWARLLLDPQRGVDHASALGRLSRAAAIQGGLGAGMLAAMAIFANGGGAFEVLLGALSAHSAVGTMAVAALPPLHLLRGVLVAARRGISYRDAASFDEAGRATAAIYVARGTLLLGEPDVVELEPAGRFEAAQVLAWIAGAEALQTHPLALAILRAAQARGVVPDAVRSPVVVPGLGIKSITSTGEPLLVGSRALMLEERVSIAMAEARATELESLGRTVLLVAVGSRLAGLVALQDGLRPGARASVQHLLDAEIEPILLSGDSRETCETIGRALDIEHVRPEILPAERAAEVRRLAESGAKAAVFGRTATDGAVLGAADVAVALQAAGTSPGEWQVSLVTDDIRDAALALTLAHRARAEGRTALLLALAPGITGALAVAFGLLPPVFAPLTGLLGGLLAATHARVTTARRPEQPLTPWDLVPPSLPDPIDR